MYLISQWKSREQKLLHKERCVFTVQHSCTSYSQTFALSLLLILKYLLFFYILLSLKHFTSYSVFFSSSLSNTQSLSVPVEVRRMRTATGRKRSHARPSLGSRSEILRRSFRRKSTSRRQREENLRKNSNSPTCRYIQNLCSINFHRAKSV